MLLGRAVYKHAPRVRLAPGHRPQGNMSSSGIGLVTFSAMWDVTFGWDACPGRASHPRHRHMRSSAQHSLKVATSRANPPNHMLLVLFSSL